MRSHQLFHAISFHACTAYEQFVLIARLVVARACFSMADFNVYSSASSLNNGAAYLSKTKSLCPQNVCGGRST